MIDDMDLVFENIEKHYCHACAKHVKFCDQFMKTPGAYVRRAEVAKRVRDWKSSVKCCTMRDVLDAEILEIHAAFEQEKYEKAEEEVYDAIAVLLRAIEMIRENGGRK
jgi:hypothetical protein